MQKFIHLKQVQLHFPESDKPLFEQLNLSISQEKTGIVGSNGSGKSCLLKLITGELNPQQGSIEATASINQLPQRSSTFNQLSVAQVLKVDGTLSALERIYQGSTNSKDYEIVGDNWLLKESIMQELAQKQLSHLSLTQTFASLSGGEKTRLLLLRLSREKTDFTLLDEPSNNLDLENKGLLYSQIAHWQGGLIVASHDRRLLAHMDRIIEITPLGIKHYGGNYQLFTSQKTQEQNAKQQQLKDSAEKLQNKKANIQKTLTQHSRNTKRGLAEKAKQIKAKGQYNKIEIKSKQGVSERSLTRIKKQAKRQLQEVEEQLQEAKANIFHEKTLNFDLNSTSIAESKAILDIKDLSFSYSQQQNPIINKFSLNITGPERIALTGSNGSGKSTLIKLILGEIEAQQGSIEKGTNRIAYLDQHCSQLNDELSVLQNLQAFQPNRSTTEAHQLLARFKFRNQFAHRKVKQLSGGERMKALLACILTSEQAPQLLLLDEPNNHLDIKSIEYLEQVLNQYQGALLVISHDQDFLQAINIKKTLSTT